jgi:hypothetical protein
MSNDNLQDAVTATTATVAKCQSQIAGLQSRTAELDSVVARSIGIRQDSALAATLGDSKARFAIATARAAQHEAEQELAEVGFALPAAKTALAEAEREEKAAREALGKHQAQKLQRHRIGRTGVLDGLLVQVAAVIAEIDADGEQIVNTPGLYAQNMFGTGLSQFDEIKGDRRLRAAIAFAMGTRLERIYRTGHDAMKAETLASSEARVWSLPPEENADDKKAA